MLRATCLTKLSQHLQLPSPYSQFTNRIRKLYSVEFLRQIILTLRSRENRGQSASVGIQSIRLLHRDTQTIRQLWGGLGSFLRSFPRFFEVLNEREVRLRQDVTFSLNSRTVFEFLCSIVPKRGGISLDDCALFAQMEKPKLFYAIFLESEECATMFIVKYNQQRKMYFFWKADDVITNLGFGPGSNKPVAYALEAAAALVPVVPKYWVPLDECLEKISEDGVNSIQRVGNSRISYALLGGIQFATFSGTDHLFVKRHPYFLQGSLHQCEHTYKPFALTTERVAKLAFSLPINPCSLEKASELLFPSIKSWLEECEYDLRTIVCMYPTMLSMTADERVCSIIRQQFPLFVPEGSTNCHASEEAFERTIQDPVNAHVLSSLEQSVASPSSQVFIDCFVHPALTLYHDSLRNNQEQTLLGHSKMIEIIQQCLRRVCS